MISELTKVFKAASKEKTCARWTHIRRGAEFCAGADLRMDEIMAEYTQAGNMKDSQKLAEMFSPAGSQPPGHRERHGHTMRRAWVSSVLVISLSPIKNTQFCFSEVKLGLSPAVISVFVQEKAALGYAEDIFSAEVFDAKTACESGLVHAVTDSEAHAQEEVKKCASAICANGPHAVSETKKLLRQVRNLQTEARLKTYTTQVISKLRVGEEGQEGLKSFFEKRAPNWRRS